jgi:hypothetical protein
MTTKEAILKNPKFSVPVTGFAAPTSAQPAAAPAVKEYLYNCRYFLF